MTAYMHIKWVKTDDKRLVRRYCLDCKVNSYAACFFEEWYGWDSTCLKCGREWCDGEWMALGFYRHARRDNIDGARRRWRR